MKYIVMKAETDSEWDGVSFALLPFDRIGHLKSFSKKALKLMDDFNELSLYSDEVDFYSDDAELPIKLSDTEIVELTEEEVSKLSTPEQTIKYGVVKYTSDGIMFVSSGKHTGEEYFCALPLDYLAKL